MGLIEKAANMIHKNQGWFSSDSYGDAKPGSWGTKDTDLFERLGDLKTVKGIPDPTFELPILRTPRWWTDEAATVSPWTVKTVVPGGLSSLEVKLEFSSKYSVACYLAEYNEVKMANLDPVGDALVELYRKSGKDWKLSYKWVFSALEVKSGFIVMAKEKNSTVTLSGQGVLSAGVFPLKLVLRVSSILLHLLQK